MQRIKIRKTFLNQEGKNDPGLKNASRQIKQKIYFHIWYCKAYFPNA